MSKLRRPRLSLDLLRGFCVAARHLSFTRAAQELFVTQPAISREIRTLEEQLGQPLFERKHRALKLTRAGEELYRTTQEALRLLDNVTDQIAGVGKALTVTTTTGLASMWLAPRLPRFNSLHAGIDVHLLASTDQPDLDRDQLDIAIRFVPDGGDVPNDEPLMGAQCFPTCSPALVSHPMHPLRTPADLVYHVKLDYESIRDGRRISEWDFWFQATKTRPVVAASTLRFPLYDHVLTAAAQGIGVGIAVLPHAREFIRDGRLCAPFGRKATVKRGAFFIVIRRDVAGMPAVRAFVDWLRSEVEHDREPEPARVKARARPSIR
jgi:LysR family transcriptional regulator, glycine cleavage system transcriptional activator